jgi:PAS domain S-box-containing protein
MVESVVQSHAEIVVDSTEKKLIRVLHVDDELGLLKVAKQCLELQGPFHVETATSVEEALSKLKEEEYDAVVSDYQMPGKDGLEFLEMLRKNGNTIPFIMFTGKGREEVAVKAWGLGADHYVNKTGDPETVYCELAHCLRSTVEKRFAEAQMKETVQKLQTIYQNAVEGITYVDAEENIVFANKAFADMVGYEQDQLAGMNLRKTVDDENWAKIERETERRRQGESSRYEAELRRRDGTVRNVLISGAPLLDSNGRFVGTSGIVLDITEQKKTREDIEQSEKRFKGIFESVDDGLVYLDASGRIIEVNRKAVEIFGGSKEELLGKRFTKIGVLSLKEVPTFTKRFIDILRGKEAFLDVTIKNKKGQAIPLECSASVSKAYGKTTIAVVARDMTEHRERERLLRESEEKYRGLFENARDVIVLFDLKGNVISVNKAAEKYGFNKSEILGKNMLKFVSKRYWPKLLKDTAPVTLGKTVKGRIEIHTPKGDKLAEYRSNPIFSHDRVVGIQTILEDTTGHKKEEEDLRESEGRYNALIESINDVFFAMDRDFRYTYWNKASERLTGISAKDAIGKSLTEVFPDVEGTEVEQFYLNTLRTNQHQAFVNKYRMGDKDSVFEIDAYPTKDGLSVFVKDISERKKAEEVLQKSEEKWRSLAENAPNIIVIVDRVGTIQFINRTVVDARPEEIVGRSVYDFIDPEHHNVVKKTIEQVFQTGEGGRYGISGVGPKGSVAWYETHAGPIKHDGQTVAVTLITTDLTERKKTEELLRESEGRFRDLFESIQDPVGIFVGREGCITDYNIAFKKSSGYTDEELKGKVFLDFVHPDDRAMVLEKYRTEYSEDEFPMIYEIRGVNKKGECIPLELSVSTYKKKGKVIGIEVIHRDLTERKKAEESVRAREERYRSFIEVTGQLGWTTNANGEVEEDVPAWRKYTGQSYEEAKGWGWTKALHPDDLEHTEQAWEKAVAEKSSYEIEYRMRRHDGVYRNFMARGVPVLEKDGKIREWVGTCIDITERKKAEEALKDSEGKFRNLAEKSPNMIFINQKGRVVYANRKAEDSMGYMREEFCSPDFNFLDLIAEESKESVKSAFSKHTRGDDVAPCEYKLITKEGRTIDAIINSKMIKYDGEPAILGVATDITDRKKAERMTLASQQNFKALFMGNPEAAAHLAPDFHILDVNPRFEELFGYSLAEAKGRHINDVIVPETRMEEAETLDKNAVGGFVYHNTVRKRKDGSLVPVALSAATIMVEGKLAGCIAMYKDISELKNAEKKLETMNEKLRVVGGLTRHDVRNKLSAITGNIYLNRKKSAGNPDVLRSYEDMESACEQIVGIFDFAKDYEMLGVEELSYADVEDVVQKAVSLFSDLNGVKVVNECHSLTVLADSLLRQLFYNLIDNSLKYGKKLSQIRIHYEKAEGNQLRLIYEDDGVGISKDAKAKLFTEGFTTGKGSGYGLYLIRRMMEVYGWTINETGTHGKGAQFTIDIPKAKPDGRQNYRLS